MSRRLKQWPPPKTTRDVSYADFLSNDAIDPYIGATTKELFERLDDDLFFSVYYDQKTRRLYTSFDGGCSPDAVEETLKAHKGKL